VRDICYIEGGYRARGEIFAILQVDTEPGERYLLYFRWIQSKVRDICYIEGGYRAR
jgi:hypothetical protein